MKKAAALLMHFWRGSPFDSFLCVSCGFMSWDVVFCLHNPHVELECFGVLAVGSMQVP